MDNCKLATMRMALACLFLALAFGCFAPAAHAWAADGGRLVEAHAANADTFVVNGVVYSTAAQSDCVSVGSGSLGDAMIDATGAIAIPDTVTHEGVTYEVTSISSYAFSNRTSGAAITTVTLPKTIESIGDYAFYGCGSLSSVSISGGSELSAIGAYAFANCSTLSSFAVPSGVTSIGMFAFANCNALEAFSFDEVGNDAPALVLGEGVLRSSNNAESALKSLELPARLVGVPSTAFQYQDALEEVRFAGEKVSSIGSYAFLECKSMKTLEIPELAAAGNSKFGTNPFYGLRDLETIVLKGNQNYAEEANGTKADYSLSTGNFNLGSFATKTKLYPDVKTVVYCGEHSSKVLFSDANHYQRISYFETKEAAEQRADQIGEAYVRDDVALRDVAASVGCSDDKGALVYAGDVPHVDGAGVWVYVGFAPSSCATDYVRAYACAPTDLASAEIQFESTQVVHATTGVFPSYRVFDASGAELVEDEDFTVTVVDGQGEQVQSRSLEEEGAYELVVSAKQGSGYSGSLAAGFEVVAHSCAWTRASGDAQHASANHMTDTAFGPEEVDTVILVSEAGSAAGLAAGGLAGVRHAPIVVTGESSLSMEATRTLTTYGPSSVILVGFSNASAVSAQVRDVLDANVTVSNPFVDASASGVSYKLYARTKRSGYWADSATAFVAKAGDGASTALAGTYAYRTKSPVFLTDDGSTLGPDIVKVLVEDGFSRVVSVGLGQADAASIGRQLKAAGCTAAIESKTAASPCVLSILLAEEQIDAGLGSYDNITLVSSADYPGLLTAVSTCGENESPLIVVDAGDEDAVLELLESNKYGMTQGYLFGSRAYVSADLQDLIQRVWARENEQSLLWATVSLEWKVRLHDGAAHVPSFKVTSVQGTELRQDEDYTVAWYSDANDTITSPSAIRDAGSYTIVVTGAGEYAGQRGVSFRIASNDLADAETVLSETASAYSGSEIRPAVSVRMDETTLEKGADYTVAYADNVNAGTATVIVKGAGAYAGEARCTFDIAPLDLATAANAQASVAKLVYTGHALTPSVKVTRGAVELLAGTDFQVICPTAIDAGSYALTIAGAGNYSGSMQVPFSIGKATQSVKLKKPKATLKASKLKSKAVKVKIKATAKTKLAYSPVGKKAKKALKVTKNGKATVRKGAKKGKYKVKVTAAATSNFESASATFTIRVK